MVDNNSTDGSKDFFSNRFPQVKFIWKKENTGFAKANNEALKLAVGEKILFLNPDTILPEDCLEKCLSFFNQQKNIGALGIRMIDGAGNFLPESKRGFPSFFTSFCKMTGLTALFPHSKSFAHYYLGHLPEEKNNEVDILSGAFMMIDKKVLDAVGSFDEDYFMYAEDIDLSYRIQKAGYKNFYFAESAIIHFKGESVSKQSPAYIRNFYGTMILFIQKHYNGVAKGLYILLLRMLISFKSLLAGKAKENQVAMPDNIFVITDTATFNSKRIAIQKLFGHATRIDNIAGAKAGSAILFFEGSLPVAEIISLVKKYKNQYQFYFHADKTKSIVGSADKNNPGFGIALYNS